MNHQTRTLSTRCASALLLAGLSGTAAAHTFGAEGAGFAAGLAHPFLGLDHLLAMIGVGLWAAQLGGQARWQLPLAFLMVMAGGAWLGQAGPDLAGAEIMIALSVVTLGVLVALSARMAGWLGIGLVSLFALFHGYAHGQEIPQAAAPLTYAAGLLLATLMLHLIGLGLGLSASRLRAASRVGGLAMAATGVYLLASL
jgi:urease accessory protein